MCVCVCVCVRREATWYRARLLVVKSTMATFLSLEEICGHCKHFESLSYFALRNSTQNIYKSHDIAFILGMLLRMYHGMTLYVHSFSQIQ